MSMFGDPFVSTPFGAGTPVEATVPPAPSVGARFIDIVRRDYVLDPATGDYQRMPTTRQRVYLAVLLVRLPDTISDASERALTNDATAALQALVDDGSIRIDSISFAPQEKTGLMVPTVAYTDLASLDSDVLQF